MLKNKERYKIYVNIRDLNRKFITDKTEIIKR